LISYSQALCEIESLASPKTPRSVPIIEAYGAICREDIYSSCDLPSFECSSTDGFAILSKNTINASPSLPKYFNVIGTLAASSPYINHKHFENNSVWEIMTGARLPLECDSVEKIEDASVFRDDNGKIYKIAINKPVPQGQYVRHYGEDFKKNDLIICKGTRIEPKHIMALACIGRASIEVSQTPRAMLICTGSELETHQSDSLPDGKVRNCIGPYLINELTQMGVKTTYLGMVEDNEQVFMRIIEKALSEKPDIIVTTGGVSDGRFDIVPKCVNELGIEKCFYKVSVRPGEPILVGKYGNTIFWGLSGNPISAVVGARFFIDPFVRSLMGLKKEKRTLVKLFNEVKKPKEFCCFYRGRIFSENSELKVEVFDLQASHLINPYIKANCWAILDSNEEKINKDTLIETLSLNSYIGFNLNGE